VIFDLGLYMDQARLVAPEEPLVEHPFQEFVLPAFRPVVRPVWSPTASPFVVGEVPNFFTAGFYVDRLLAVWADEPSVLREFFY
jgi:hypothetical protein